MSFPVKHVLLACALLTVGTVHAQLAQNASVRAKVLQGAKDLPIFFTVPTDAMSTLTATQRLSIVDYIHPDSATAREKAGLRFFPIKRASVQTELSKFLANGDIVLSFRKEWAGTGPYPQVQMGVSHAGVVFFDNGKLKNIDNPMNAEYVGALNSQHYIETPLLHVVRPRNLTAKESKNIAAWSKLLNDKRSTIYPNRISFNQDYAAPNYNPAAAEPLDFVKKFGSIALGVGNAKVSMFCSEFAWSLLALRKCDPVTDKAKFSEAGIPSCVSPVFQPMKAIEDYAQTQSPGDAAGMAEGPLLVLQALDLPASKYQAIVNDIFTARPDRVGSMSSGHRAVAESMAPMFAPLQNYYLAYNSGAPEIAGLKDAFNQGMKQNYSPTGYLINTLLPENNSARSMDYVATLVFVD